MTHKRAIITLVAGIAAGALLFGSAADAQQLGGRSTKQIGTFGKKKTMSVAEAKKKVKARILTASDVRKRKQTLNKLARKKETIIRRLIRLMGFQVRNACPDSGKCPAYLFRLALHQYAMRENQWNKAMELEEGIFQASEKGQKARAQGLIKQRKLYFARAEWWLKKALTNYVKITTNPKFRTYGRMDEVIFTVGDIAKTLAEEAGKQGKGAAKRTYHGFMLKFFRRLTKEFPRSRYIPDALLAQGEYHFNNRELIQAIEIYRKVGRVSPKLKPYSEYKIGWCYLNLKKNRLALNKFVWVAKGGKGGKALIVAARKDVVRAYTHIGKPSAGYGFFLNVAKGSPAIAKEMFLLLGTMYYAQGKNVDTVKVFMEALKRWPRDPTRCRWVTTIVDATINQGEKDNQVKAVTWLGRVTRDLTKQLGKGHAEVKNCRQATENTMKTLATQWHAEGLRTKNVDTLERTKKLYEEYLSTYPKSPLVYLMSYQYADLVWELYRIDKSRATEDGWRKLGQTYNKIVRMAKPKNFRPKYCKRVNGKKVKADCKDDTFQARRNDAAFAAVKCFMKAVKLTDSDISKTKMATQKKICVKKRGRRCIKWEKQYPKIAIPDKEKELLGAFETYIKYVPRSKWLPAITFNTGHIYWKYNHFGKAAIYFKKIAMNVEAMQAKDNTPGYDPVRAARVAAYRIIGMLIVQKKFKVMRKYVSQFVTSKKLMEDQAFATKMYEYRLNAMYADASELAKKGKYFECGQLYEELATDPKFQNDTRLDTFYWNAGDCYERAGMLGPAVQMRRRIIKLFPKSKHRALAMFFNAGNLHNLAFFPEAAKAYEKFFKKYPKHKEAAKSLMWGIVLRGGLGEEKAMRNNSAAFISKYGRKKPKESARAFWLMVKMYEGQANTGRFLEAAAQYLRHYGRKGGPDRYIEASAKLGELFWQKSCKVPMTHGQCIRIKYVRKKGKRKKQRKIVYLSREGRDVRSARRFFGRAVRAWANGASLRKIPKNAPDYGARIFAARKYAAYSQFMAAEFKFEGYLKLKLPKMKFKTTAQTKASIKKFMKWLKSKNKEGAGLRANFQKVFKVRIGKVADSHWAIAATARQGMIFHNFADLLDNFERPKGWTWADWDKWREGLERPVNGLLTVAKKMYGLCLGVSNRLKWFNEWSRLCEREINRLEPEKYPLASELRAQPGYVATQLSQADFITEVK